MIAPPCRLCGAPLRRTFVDLGMSPPCEAFLPADRVEAGETFYPLHVRVCDACLLVQLPECLPAEQIFTDEYVYFSSYSTSWVEHARRYANRMIDQLRLGTSSLVVEVASNDGYLLQHFQGQAIPVLGIEPSSGVARAAQEKGIRTEIAYLGGQIGRDVAKQYGPADLVVGNNVLAHVPDLRDFVAGLGELLADGGLMTLEFPHLMRLIDGRQYDTIYHEHFSYLTLLTAQRALATADLTVVDAEELSTHGGSLRLHVRHTSDGESSGPAVLEILGRESAVGLHSVKGHLGFSEKVDKIKFDLLDFLISAAREGKSVAGYGAPGKGNTLLNHCGIRSDLMTFTVDINPHKHGMFLPGTHIPIHPTERIRQTRPDYVVVFPWNLRAEIEPQLQYVREWGGRLVFPIPELTIV